MRVISRLAALLLVVTPLLAGCGKSAITAPPLQETPLSSLILSITSDSLVVGGTVQLAVTARDTANVIVTNPTVHWRTSDAGVATVSGSGLVTARGEGVAWVSATSGGQADSAGIFVRGTTTGWFTQASGTTNDLHGVYFGADGRAGWAVGDAGTIVRTLDAGSSWAAQPSNTSFSLRAVQFVTDSLGFAVGAAGTVLRSTNGGSTWTRLDPGTTAFLNDVWFATPDTGWAVGANGTIARTFDGGAHWTVSNPSTFQLRAVAFYGTREGWAVGDNGTICGTHDRGTSWFTVSALTSQSLRGVARLSMFDAWAVGQQGVVPTTMAVSVPAMPDTAGWTLRNAGASNNLESVMFPTTSIGWAVGANASGLVLRSPDGGMNWAPQVVSTASQLNDVWFVDTQRGWAVGNSGRIVHTATGGF